MSAKSTKHSKLSQCQSIRNINTTKLTNQNPSRKNVIFVTTFAHSVIRQHSRILNLPNWETQIHVSMLIEHDICCYCSTLDIHLIRKFVEFFFMAFAVVSFVFRFRPAAGIIVLNHLSKRIHWLSNSVVWIRTNSFTWNNSLIVWMIENDFLAFGFETNRHNDTVLKNRKWKENNNDIVIESSGIHSTHDIPNTPGNGKHESNEENQDNWNYFLTCFSFVFGVGGVSER